MEIVCEHQCPLVDRDCIAPQCEVRKVRVRFLWSCSCKRCVLYLQIDATDVLSAMGAIPPGFRPSTLSKLLEEGERSCIGSDSNQHENSVFIHTKLSTHTSTAHQICSDRSTHSRCDKDNQIHFLIIRILTSIYSPPPTHTHTVPGPALSFFLSTQSVVSPHQHQAQSRGVA